MTERKVTPEQQKEQLELEKLQLELEQLRHPVRTSVKSFTWRDIVAIVIAVSAIVIAVSTGLFNVRSERLRIEELRLEQGNKELTETRDKLQQEQEHLQAELKKTKEQLAVSQREWAAIAKVMEFPQEKVRTEVAFAGDQLRVSIRAIGEKEEMVVDPQVSDLLDVLDHIQRLSSLRVGDVALTEEDVRRIAKLKVQKLSLSRNGLADDMIDPIGRMSNLTSLSLEANKNIRHPKALGSLTNLTFLHLERTSFDDEGLASLRPFAKSLEYLFLMNTHVSDNGLRHLSDFVKLKWLHLTTCRHVTGTTLLELADLPELGFLEISWCGIPEDDLERLVNSLRKKNPSLWVQSELNLERLPVPQFPRSPTAAPFAQPAGNPKRSDDPNPN